MPKTAIQRAQPTCTGLRLVIPRAFPDDKKSLYLLSLKMTRSLIEEDIKDSTNDLVKMLLQQAYDDMTQAIYYAGGL